MVLGSQGAYRRKSSLVASEHKRPGHARQNTACFVHSLLEVQKQSGSWTPSYMGMKSGNRLDKDPDGHRDQDGHTQSRLLTKKQLSDMAYGIRELSKRLGHVRLILNVRNVFILTKAHDETIIKYTREVTEWLLEKDRDRPYTVYVEETLQHNPIYDAEGLRRADPSYKDRLKYWNSELCAKKPQTFDIVVALGGDGTVLYASWLFQRVVPPVLSFALGSLGFLTKFDYELFPETLSKAFKEGITVSLRLRFEATVMRSQRNHGDKARDMVEELIGEESGDVHTHRPDRSHNILNDLVLDRGPNPSKSTTPSRTVCRRAHSRQRCLPSRCLATTNTSPPCRPMASAWPHLPAAPRTTWQQVARCVIQTTPSSSSRRSARTR